MNAQTKARSLTATLVRVPSVDSAPAVLSAIRAALPRGTKVKRVVSQKVTNLVITKRFTSGGKTLAFNGHYDTVPVAPGWITPALTPVVRNGKMYALGTADMKGGIAAMIVAFNALCADSRGLRGALELHVVGDEENGGFHGTRVLVQKHKMPDACVNCEPTNLDLAVSTKGVVHARLTATGKSAHGSRPHHGQNAIEMLHRSLTQLWNAFPTRKITNANALNRITLNTGMIRGGVARNVVAGEASAELDFRIPARSYARDRAKVLAALRAACKNGVRFTIVEDEPAWMAPENHAFVKLAKTVLARTRGSTPKRVEKTGATDARFYGAKGVPTVDVGPGDPFVIHKPNEFVPLRELDVVARYYEDLARAYLR